MKRKKTIQRKKASRTKAGWAGTVFGTPVPKRAVKALGAGCLAAALCAAGPGAGLTAFAGSPEFAYTAEEWAQLRDNKLEFDEIPRLIHEYNATVIQNQIEYEEYRNEDSDDIAADYYDAAEEIYNRLEYPDSTSSSFASELASYLSGQIQADELTEQGDDNVDDGDSKKLGYDQTEAQLAMQAQQQMISYWSQYYSLDSIKVNGEQAQATYDSEVVKLGAGMSTQAEVLTARDAVDSYEASLLSAESSLKQTKENLCLALGWTYGAEVEICELPEPDLTWISQIDLAADVEKGIENNYSLKILERQINNAQNSSNKASLQENYKSQKETASTSISSAYEQLKIAVSDYEQASQALALEADKMASAERKMAAGVMNRNEYLQQKYSYAAAETKERTSRISILEAQNKYEWAVNGLADVS